MRRGARRAVICLRAMDRAMPKVSKPDEHFQQQQARAAERAVRQRQRDFGDEFRG